MSPYAAFSDENGSCNSKQYVSFCIALCSSLVKQGSETMSGPAPVPVSVRQYLEPRTDNVHIMTYFVFIFGKSQKGSSSFLFLHLISVVFAVCAVCMCARACVSTRALSANTFETRKLQRIERNKPGFEIAKIRD
jgi:hypothetical protein